jgi:hypothetical protein
MTLRRYLTTRYDWTGLSSKLFKSKIWGAAALFVIGLAALLVMLFYIPSLADLMKIGESFEKTAIVLVGLFIFLPNVFRMYWFTMRNKDTKIPIFLNMKAYISKLWTLIPAVIQLRTRGCPENRWLKHLLLASGYVLLLTSISVLGWYQTAEGYPIYHPLRLLGYYATGVLIFFTAEALISRFKKRGQMHKFSELGDWLFLILLFMIALTALATHIFLSIGFEMGAYYTYVFFLVVLAQWAIVIVPFGKWTHIIYRPIAIYLQAVKESVLQKSREVK